MLFTTGAAYIAFATDNIFSLQDAAKESILRAVERESESLSVESSELSDGDLGVSMTNTGAVPVQVREILILGAQGNIIKDIKMQTLPITLNPHELITTTVDTNITLQPGAEYAISIITERGTIVSDKYPEDLPRYVQQAQASGSIAIDFTSFKWVANDGDTQSGLLVGGYPAYAFDEHGKISFKISFTNLDPEGRGVTLWPTSVLSSIQLREGGGIKESSFFISEGLADVPSDNSVKAYNSTSSFVHIDLDETVTLWFGSDRPLGDEGADEHLDWGAQIISLSLEGFYDDNTFYGQTIPFLTAYASKAQLNSVSPDVALSGTLITVTGTDFKIDGRTEPHPAFVGLMPPDGSMVLVKTFMTQGGTGKEVSTTFNVPSISPGYYILVVSDYANTVFYTFQVT